MCILRHSYTVCIWISILIQGGTAPAYSCPAFKSLVCRFSLACYNPSLAICTCRRQEVIPAVISVVFSQTKEAYFLTDWPAFTNIFSTVMEAGKVITSLSSEMDKLSPVPTVTSPRNTVILPVSGWDCYPSLFLYMPQPIAAANIRNSASIAAIKRFWSSLFFLFSYNSANSSCCVLLSFICGITALLLKAFILAYQMAGVPF